MINDTSDVKCHIFLHFFSIDIIISILFYHDSYDYYWNIYAHYYSFELHV